MPTILMITVNRHYEHRISGHVHAPSAFGCAFAIGVLLNFVYVGAEARRRRGAKLK
jgi:hypothetical protein